DDHLHLLRTLDEANRHLLSLGGVELWCLAQDAQHRDAFAADFGVEIRQPIDRCIVDPTVIVERGRCDRKGTCCLGGKFRHFAPLASVSYSGTRPLAWARNLYSL